MTKIIVPDNHPRKVSLDIRDRIIDGHEKDIVATAGLLAHGRGEAFDYFIGEETTEEAKTAIRAAAAALLIAKHPVISVNGNVCSLVPNELIELHEITGAELEINLFYYRPERETAILAALQEAGATRVLGTHDRPSETIPELSHNRRKVDSEGIAKADLVLVPLEDGDRTQALRKIGKFVVTIDLNPISRTSIFSNITIIDNIIRAMPLMVEYVWEMHDWPRTKLERLVSDFDNEKTIQSALEIMIANLAAKGATGLKGLKEAKQ